MNESQWNAVRSLQRKACRRQESRTANQSPETAQQYEEIPSLAGKQPRPSLPGSIPHITVFVRMMQYVMAGMDTAYLGVDASVLAVLLDAGRRQDLEQRTRTRVPARGSSRAVAQVRRLVQGVRRGVDEGLVWAVGAGGGGSGGHPGAAEEREVALFATGLGQGRAVLDDLLVEVAEPDKEWGI